MNYSSLSIMILLNENINTIKKSTKDQFEASKEVGLEVKTKKTEYMVLSRHKNIGKNHSLLTAIKSWKMWHISSIWK
jgi:hypothetical protein